MSKSNERRYFETSFQSDNPGLRSYFDNVVKGQPKIFDTPFAKGESTEHMLSSWQEVLKSIAHEWPSLWNFEIDLAKKVGPLSIMRPLDERMDDIEAYYAGVSSPATEVSERAIKAVCAEFSQIRGLTPRLPKAVIERMKMSTNSGSPYFTKRRNVRETGFEANVFLSDAYPDAVFQRGDYTDEYLPGPIIGGNWTAAAVLGWRGQEGGPSKSDVKQRVVWMFPYWVNIRELSVYQPMIEASQMLNLVPAWISNDVVDRRITDMFDTKSSDDLVVCTDFSKFDQHFGPAMQNAARAILTACLDNSDRSKVWLDYVFPVKYMIPLAYDMGKVRFGKHGMGSGSGGTNCDETLAHRALQYEAAQSAGARLNPNSQCLGDDGILTYPGITVEDVVKAYTSHGLEMNHSKQYASTQDCVYLRRWHHDKYRINGVCAGVYSTCRVLGKLRYLERFMDPNNGWDERAVALRQLSIIENVKYHPLKEQFVKFCMKRDKYRLGIDIPHFLDNIEKVAREKIELMPDFLGYTKSLQSGSDPARGIGSWWVVQFLKSMR